MFGINIGPNKNSINRFEDYILGLRKFHKLADYLAINISSPNTENLRKFHDEQELNRLLDAIYKERAKIKTNVPIAVKISPDLDDESIFNISEILLRFQVDAAIISNTTDKNRERLSDVKKNEAGGLSGQPLKDLSTNLIKKFYKETKGKTDCCIA